MALLKAKADKEARREGGLTPLFSAVVLGQTEVGY